MNFMAIMNSDGFSAQKFHSLCDQKGPTMTIILSNNNYLFGGYTSISWTSDGNNKSDTTAFLFSLTNPHNIPSTKYLISSGHTGSAVGHHGNDGPKFGHGRDIKMESDSNANNSSYTSFPSSYIDTTDIEIFKRV